MTSINATIATNANTSWQLLVFDGAPEATDIGSCRATQDFDGKGTPLIVMGGIDGIVWYQPDTFERGKISDLSGHVGIWLEDLDGDGVQEVVSSLFTNPGKKEAFQLAWFHAPASLGDPWTMHWIEHESTGAAHDVVMADVDGDGINEIVVNAVYCAVPGVFFYKRDKDPTQLWHKYRVQERVNGEGLAVADLDNDGQVEIICGPSYWHRPADGPLCGRWDQHHFAHGFREFCRVAVLDINNDSHPEIVIVESEYPDGRMSWFERDNSVWLEHPINAESGAALGAVLNYAHSLASWKNSAGEACIFAAEMERGGWEPTMNWQARLMQYTSADGGANWQATALYTGTGTHEAVVIDIDGDHALEIVGKTVWDCVCQLWKQRQTPQKLTGWRHCFLDRDKPHVSTDLLVTDIDGDGTPDVACGEWWYQAPDWERYDIPGIYQVHAAADIDGDGRDELIASRAKDTKGSGDWYSKLSAELVWLKPIDPINGIWEPHVIGRGDGDWAHGACVAAVLPNGKRALLISYHNCEEGAHPQLFEIPADPTHTPWPKCTLAEIPFGEEWQVADLDGDGLLDIVAGTWWLHNKGDGTFATHKIVSAKDYPYMCRARIVDVNGDGRPDIVATQEWVDYATRTAGQRAVLWFENTGKFDAPWPVHGIDKIRSPHSLDVFDFDGDGKLELVVGEHDPFKPYRSSGRLYVYEQADALGRSWWRHEVDTRFEHHDGAKVIALANGKHGIVSHGWAEGNYVHLWEQTA
jgi:hypothetical protein